MGNNTESNVLVLEDVQAALKAKTISKKQYDATFTPGTRFFVRKTGSTGTVLAETTPNGKKFAMLTCTKGGPDHKRLQSDWHQCGVSPEMKKTSKKKSTEEVVAAAEEVRTAATQALNTARESVNLPPVAVATVG